MGKRKTATPRPKSTSRKLLDACSRLIAELPNVGPRPFTNLDGSWPELTPEEIAADPERAKRINEGKKHEDRIWVWRRAFREFVTDARRFVVDHGTAEQRSRFSANAIWAFIEDDLGKEMYKVQQCLADLQSLCGVIRQIRMRGQRRAATTKAAYGPRLLKAREAYGDTQEEAAAKLGTDQSRYSKWETGKERPDRTNRPKCDDYIRRAPKTPEH